MTHRRITRGILTGTVAIAVAAAALPGAAQVRASGPGIWSLTASMATARYNHTATLLPNGKVLVAGGENDNSGELASAELYDPSKGTWAATGNLITARAYHTATLLRTGLVLVAGGWVGNGGYPLSSAELYNPSTGTWAATASMPTPRYYDTATLLPSGKVLIVNGCTTASCNSTAQTTELFDPSTGTWTASGQTLIGFQNYTATLLRNGKVLIAGGPAYPSTSAEGYNPTTGTWTATGSMHIGRAYHSAALLPSGQVLVAGGLNAFNHGLPAATAELYNPTTGTWNFTNSMSTARQLQTETLLHNGLMLVAGGFNTQGHLASAELYNNATSTWSTAGSMSTGRNEHTATLLPGGQVLIAGGFGGPGHTLSSAELYTPS